MRNMKALVKLAICTAMMLPLAVCADIGDQPFGSRERRYERIGHEISRDLLREINKQKGEPRWASSEIVYLMWASLFVIASVGAVVFFFYSKRRMRALMDWLLEMAWDCYGVLNRNVGAHIPEYYQKRMQRIPEWKQ